MYTHEWRDIFYCAIVKNVITCWKRFNSWQNFNMTVHPFVFENTQIWSTCVRAFAFHLMNWSQIKAQYIPRTPLFEFWLNKLGSGNKLLKLQNKSYKVSWGGKMTATQSSTIPLSIKRLKECSFTLFHHIFWNRLWGGCCVGILGVFDPKGALGSQKHVEEVSEDV